MGGPPPADLRGRPPRVSDVPRAHADHRLHHAAVGDRPDPDARPHPRHHRGARRRAESPIDAGTGDSGRSTIGAVTPGRPARALTAPRGTRRDQACPAARPPILARRGTPPSTRPTPSEFPIPHGVSRLRAPRTLQRGQPAAVTLHAWKAQQRLYTAYHRLSMRRGPQIAVVAVARELVGYLWAVMRDLEAAREAAPSVAA